ncbi:unnamed protein product, partial [Allacma fusca]
PWVLGAVAVAVVLIYLPDIMRQIAIWIARVRREFHNVNKSLTSSLSNLEGHLKNMDLGCLGLPWSDPVYQEFLLC